MAATGKGSTLTPTALTRARTQLHSEIDKALHAFRVRAAVIEAKELNGKKSYADATAQIQQDTGMTASDARAILDHTGFKEVK